jgi:hypothetical protein
MLPPARIFILRMLAHTNCSFPTRLSSIVAYLLPCRGRASGSTSNLGNCFFPIPYFSLDLCPKSGIILASPSGDCISPSRARSWDQRARVRNDLINLIFKRSLTVYTAVGHLCGDCLSTMNYEQRTKLNYAKQSQF